MAKNGATGHLPPGWDLRRVRDVAQAPDADVASTDLTVVWESSDELVEVDAVLQFGSYVVVHEPGGDRWAKGGTDAGRVTSWARYDDLETALRGL